MLSLLPFECAVHNNYSNVILWIHPSPSENGIILFDVNILNETGKVIESHYLKLIPEGTENVVYFGKDRQKSTIPAGNIQHMDVSVSNNNGACFLRIQIEFYDETEHLIPWQTREPHPQTA